MDIWYFTFGAGQHNSGYCQPIQAKTSEKARKHMIKMYGYEWSNQYTSEQWDKMKHDSNRYWPLEKELNIIIV